MTNRIAVAIAIDAAPAEVWRIVEPIEDHVRWMQDAVTIRFVGDQRRGVGTRFLVDTKVGPLKLTDDMTVTDWLEGEAMGVRHTGVVTGVGRFALEPIGPGGTTFSWTEDLHFPWWLGGSLGGRVGRVVLGAIWRKNLRALKAVVEQGDTASSS